MTKYYNDPPEKSSQNISKTPRIWRDHARPAPIWGVFEKIEKPFSQGPD